LSPRERFLLSPVLKATTETSTLRLARSWMVWERIFTSLGPKTETWTWVRPWVMVAQPSAWPCCEKSMPMLRSSYWRRPSERNPPSLSISTREAYFVVVGGVRRKCDGRVHTIAEQDLWSF
jgi:hypothetical protein